MGCRARGVGRGGGESSLLGAQGEEGTRGGGMGCRGMGIVLF